MIILACIKFHYKRKNYSRYNVFRSELHLNVSNLLHQPQGTLKLRSRFLFIIILMSLPVSYSRNKYIHNIPQEPFGFLPESSTLKPLRNITADIHTILKKTRSSLYACFEKASDNVDRSLFNEKIKKILTREAN